MRLDGPRSALNGFKSLEVPPPQHWDGFRPVSHEFGLLWVTLDGFRSGLDHFRLVLDGFRSSCIV